MPAPDIEAVKRDAHAQWENDPALRAEFTCRESYVAWRCSDARGDSRIFGGKVITEASPSRVAATSVASSDQAPHDLAHRQAQVRRENVGRAFAGLPALPIPQH